MASKVDRKTYEQMIAEDLAWLDRVEPRPLERAHVRLIVEQSARHEYETEPERDQLRAEVERLRAERDALLKWGAFAVQEFQVLAGAYDEQISRPALRLGHIGDRPAVVVRWRKLKGEQP